jgi:hypothetical protein
MTARVRDLTLSRRDTLFILLLAALFGELVFVLMPGPPDSEARPVPAVVVFLVILLYWSTRSRLARGVVAFVFWSQVALLAAAPLLGFTGGGSAFAFMCGLALCQCGIIVLLRDTD